MSTEQKTNDPLLDYTNSQPDPKDDHLHDKEPVFLEDLHKQPKFHGFEAFKNYIRNIFDIRDDMMSYREIDDMMLENTVIHGPNMWILMLAILIASIGLNVNSIPVIIGAMLISPLMSGIMTMGYSLAVRDIPLLKKAMVRFATQVGISLLTSTIYFLISPLDTPTSEMIARTSPTLWDVLIALFGGIAGMIGNTRTKKGNVIPGVAIATALMPPLCTAGYGLATLQAKFFFGAFYLFIINTLFIALSTALVTLVLKVPYHRTITTENQKKINHMIAVLTTIAIIPSIIIGGSTVYDSVLENNINTYLSKEFIFSNTQIVKSSYDQSNHTISVSLVGETIPDEVIELLASTLPNYNLDAYTLQVTQNVLTLDETVDQDRTTIALQEGVISQMQKQLDDKEQTIVDLEQTIRDYEKTVDSALDTKQLAVDAKSIFPFLVDCSIGIVTDGTQEYIILLGTTKVAPERLADDQILSLENWLKTTSQYKHCQLILEEASTEAVVQ